MPASGAITFSAGFASLPRFFRFSLSVVKICLTTACFAFALAGCHAPPKDYSRVSQALERRNGRTLAMNQAGQAVLPPGVVLEDGLTQEEAISVALWNNAAFLEGMSDLGISRADIVQAGMLPNPTLSMLVPWGAKGLELTAKYPLDALWLQPKRTATARANYEQTVQRLTQTALDLIRDVKLSFADVALAQERLRSAEQTATIAANIGKLSRVRLDAGDASELEVSTARADLMQTEELLARARQDERLALERLRAWLGMGLKPFPNKIIQPPTIPVSTEVNVLVTNALVARPDLRAAELGIEAAGKRIGLARLEAFTLAAGVNAKDVNNEFLAGPAVDFAVPILNQNQGGIALAKANFEKAARHYYTVRDKIVLEIRESHTRFLQARESLEKWQTQILPPLEAALQQAQKTYEAGEASLLLVLESTRRLEDARARASTARADWHRAAAELERGMGGRLPETSTGTKE